jgi:hypothetical protein
MLSTLIILTALQCEPNDNKNFCIDSDVQSPTYKQLTESLPNIAHSCKPTIFSNSCFSIVPGFLKDKTKLLFVSKKFWKRTRTKAFGPKLSGTD